MEGLHNMDGEFEADNLDMFFDWNDDEFIPTFLQSDSPITALEDPNLMENFSFQTEVAPVNPSVVMESIDEAQSQVQPTEPTSWFSQGPSTEMDFTFIPNPLPPPPPPNTSVNGIQLNNSLSSPILALDGEGPSFRGQDVTQTGSSNQFSDSQNENLQLDLHSNGDQNLSNQVSVPNTFGINNFNGLNINQSSPNPGMVHPDMVQVTPAIETYASGVFAPPQRPAFFPLQNHISNSHSAWNSRPQHTQFSSPHMYGALYAPNHMQSFSTVHNQVGHSSELQHIHALQSQNSIWPVNPMYPRLEPYSDLNTAFVTMPSIPYQQGFRPMLPEPAVRSAFSVANYGQQPNNLFLMSNSHGSGSLVPPTNQMYSPLYQNQNQGHYHHPQVIMMPNNQAQQSSASMQQWSQGVSNHISTYNQRMNTPNLQRHSSRAEASSSRLSISREANIAPVLRIQEEATIPNEVRISRDMRNVQGTSSTRSEPSEAIRRILDMNPSRLISRSVTVGGSHQTERVRYKPPPRGRPPKRHYEEYFQREKLQKVSSEIGNGGTTSTSQQAQHIPCSYQNAAATNAPSAPRPFVNSVCDIELGRIGHPIDPHLTLFKPQPEK